ncbi:unnamed protein product [Rhizopus stolonifer]
MSFNTNSKNTCVITNVDSCLGYALAYRFLEAKKKKEDDFIARQNIRVFCRDRSGYGLTHLEEMGAEIVEVDYEDQEKLRHHLKNVRSVALIPENSQKRFKEAENLIKISRDEKVEFLCMHSMIGVDAVENDQEFQNLQEYLKIEKKVKENFEDNHTVVRHTKFNQLFYFMAPLIEGENKVALPVKEDSKWGTVDINDVINACYLLVRKKHESHESNNAERMKKLYQFTPEQNKTTKEIVNEIGKGLGRENLKYSKISENELKQHLQRMRDDKRFKNRPQSQQQGEKWNHDGPWTFPLGKYLNDRAIDTVMECWRLADKGKADIKTDDLKKILNRSPRNLEEYFKKNRDQFKQFK